MSETDPAGQPPPRQFVPAPVRPGEGGVRGIDVVAGMGIGCGLMFALLIAGAFLMGGLFSVVDQVPDADVPGTVGVIVIMLAAVGGYAYAIRRAVKAKRKGWAIGMAIFAAVSVLLTFACAALLSGIH